MGKGDGVSFVMVKFKNFVLKNVEKLPNCAQVSKCAHLLFIAAHVHTHANNF